MDGRKEGPWYHCEYPECKKESLDENWTPWHRWTWTCHLSQDHQNVCSPMSYAWLRGHSPQLQRADKPGEILQRTAKANPSQRAQRVRQYINFWELSQYKPCTISRSWLYLAASLDPSHSLHQLCKRQLATSNSKGNWTALVSSIILQYNITWCLFIHIYEK